MKKIRRRLLVAVVLLASVWLAYYLSPAGEEYLKSAENILAPQKNIGRAPASEKPPIRELRKLKANTQAVQDDLQLILTEAKLADAITFSRAPATDRNFAKINCSAEKVNIEVSSNEDVWAQTFYMGLQRIGFLFPHPTRQISPTLEQIKKNCGKEFTWNPAVKYSGFHLHTLHPSEWVHGFLMGKTDIAMKTVRWLARNQQNTFDLSLLRMDDETLFKNLKEPFKLAKDLGIHAGVAVGIAFHQQRAYKLVSLRKTVSDRASLDELTKNLNKLMDHLELSFVNLEAGTSEFTPTAYRRTIKWMNKAAELADARDISIFIKIHTSSNQHDKTFGNYNFIPQFTDPKVGVLPHTVFLYGINDESAPMYGNKNFHHIRDFMLTENQKRPTWFYPETSYYLGLDIDAPLLLTNYLKTKANDTRLLSENNVQGQLNFSTGQELGYWLIDWSYALLNNRDYNFDPLIGIKLLGEDEAEWKKIVDFQDEYFIKKHGIGVVTFADFGSEAMPKLHQILKRNILKDLSNDRSKLQAEIDLLSETIKAIPEDVKVKDPELRALWNVTRLRVHHAYNTREALNNKATKATFLQNASALRAEAQSQIDFVYNNYNRYPEARLFEKQRNPTAYGFGYAYTVRELHYWKREEEAIRQSKFSFTFMSLLGVQDILRGWVL